MVQSSPRSDQPLGDRLQADLKNDLIAGLLVVIPLATTIWLATTVSRFVLAFLTSIPKQFNPFNTLNPLLQDPGLAFHPPMLYLGYVGFSMAFSFAVAALIGMLRRVPEGAQPDSPEPPRVLPPPLPVGKVRVGLYGSLDLLPVILIFSAFSLLVVSSLLASASPDRELAVSDLLMNIGFQIFIATMVVVYMTRRMAASDWLGLRWPAWPRVFLIGPASVMGMWLIFAVLQACGYMQWMESLGAETVQESVRLLQTTEDPAVLALMGFAAVVVDR